MNYQTVQHGSYYKNMIVTSFLNVIPPKNNSQEKVDIIHKFIKGVNCVKGDTGNIHNGNNIVDCDVAVIQGWQHERGKSSPHLKLRQDIIDHQLQKNKYVITADSNLFLFANKTNAPYHYLRYSINGVFPNTGNYCDKIVDPSRWRQISEDTDIRIKPYNTKGKHILLCCQRNGGWSMGSKSVVDWIIETVNKIRKYSDRTIVVRAHPGDKRATEYLTAKKLRHIPNLYISSFNTPLEIDLKNAYCVVNHNSSSIVGPIIMGYHAFITDPIKSQCAEVAHHGFEKIESPQEFDRQKWLERISMFHWKFDELENGKCWQHMRNYCQ